VMIGKLKEIVRYKILYVIAMMIKLLIDKEL